VEESLPREPLGPHRVIYSVVGPPLKLAVSSCKPILEPSPRGERRARRLTSQVAEKYGEKRVRVRRAVKVRGLVPPPHWAVTT
jgi:hypothetical protein